MRIVLRNIRNKKKHLLFALDITCIVISSILASALIAFIKEGKFSPFLSPHFPPFCASQLIFYPLFLYIFDLYEIKNELRKKYTLTLLFVIGGFAVLGGLLVLRIVYHIWEVMLFLLFFLFVTAGLFSLRLLFFTFVVVPQKRKCNVLFIGIDVLTPLVLEALYNSDYTAEGVLSPREADLGTQKENLRVISTGKNLGTLIKAKQIKLCVWSLDTSLPLETIKKLYQYRLEGIELLRSDYFYEMLTRKFPLAPYLHKGDIPFPNIDAFMQPLFKNTKKLIDFLGSFLGLLVLAPFIVFFALLIKCTSKGPVFYCQERVGLQEKPFPLIKFRTMFHNAERISGPRWATEDDPRITAVGRFLRRTRLDEIPQLINILRGELSFIGPRPIRRHFAERIEEEIPFYSLRFSIKPGLTGWAQVNYDYGGTLEGHIEKFQYDLYYLKHASLFMDLFILLKTLQTMVRKPAP